MFQTFTNPYISIFIYKMIVFLIWLLLLDIDILASYVLDNISISRCNWYSLFRFFSLLVIKISLLSNSFFFFLQLLYTQTLRSHFQLSCLVKIGSFDKADVIKHFFDLPPHFFHNMAPKWRQYNCRFLIENEDHWTIFDLSQFLLKVSHRI